MMRPERYTEEQIEWIREQYKHMNCRQLQKAFNERFGQSRSYFAIRSVTRNHDIKAGRAAIQEIKLFTPEQVEFIKAEYRKLSQKDLLAAVNGRFGLDIKINQLKAFIKNHRIHSGRTGCIEPGSTPWNKGKKGYMGPNKTSFKKGNKPHNTKHLGHERVSKDGYIEISVPETNPHTGYHRRYRHKHVWIWEHHHGRKLPKSHAVIFKDGDRRNFDPDNLVLVHRNELLSLNLHSYHQQPDEIKPTVMALAKLEAEGGFRIISSREKRRQNKCQQ